MKPSDAKRIARMLKQIDRLASLMGEPGCRELVVNWTPGRGDMVAGVFCPSTLDGMLREFANWQTDKLRDVLPKGSEHHR